MPELKQAQFEIISKTNPASNDYHVWIRSPQDIKTFDEVINDSESFVWGDFSKQDALKALKKGTITVYSSNPIKNGAFVSTSYTQAWEYAGHNPSQVHSKTVPLDSVAWINGDEGQYAKVNTQTKHSLPDTDSKGKKLTNEQREYFKDSKIRGYRGNLEVVWHFTDENNNFNTFKPNDLGLIFVSTEPGAALSMHWQTNDRYTSAIEKRTNEWGGETFYLYGEDITNIMNGDVTGEFSLMGQRVRPYYLNAKNPFIKFEKDSDFVDFMRFTSKEQYKKDFLRDYDGVYAEDLDNIANMSNSEIIDTFYDDVYHKIQDGAYEYRETKAFVDWLKQKGYDAFSLYESGFDESTNYAFFNPNQIKLTTNQNPTKNADIRYSLPINKQEYAILRKEVARKNALNKGEVTPIGTAYTANNFYVYENYGDDSFKAIIKLKIEGNESLINHLERRYSNGNYETARDVHRYIMGYEADQRHRNGHSSNASTRDADGYDGGLYKGKPQGVRVGITNEGGGLERRTAGVRDRGLDGKQFSLPDTDSQGRKLTASQREFFKDSKVVDEKGRLLEVYHGTNEDFNVFSQRGTDNKYGKGFYFSEYKEFAKLYGDKLLSVYLDIKKPIVVGKGDYKKLGKYGYDGIIQYKNGKIAEAVVLNPNQIKLTTNLNPTTNEDIRYSLPINKQEYAILRKEVARKNALNKGEVTPIGTAYTANNFYVYENYGDDSFKAIKKLKIVGNENKINFIERRMKNGSIQNARELSQNLDLFEYERGQHESDSDNDRNKSANDSNGGLHKGTPQSNRVGTTVESSGLERRDAGVRDRGLDNKKHSLSNTVKPYQADLITNVYEEVNGKRTLVRKEFKDATIRERDGKYYIKTADGKVFTRNIGSTTYVMNGTAESSINSVLTSVAPELTMREKLSRKNIKSGLSDLYMGFQIAFVNEQAALEKEMKRLGIKGFDATVNFARSSRSAGEQMLFTAQYSFDGQYVGESLSDILKPVAKDANAKQEFFHYLFAKHHIDRMKYGKPVLNISTEAAQKLISKYEKSNPQFVEMSKKTSNCYNALRLRK